MGTLLLSSMEAQQGVKHEGPRRFSSTTMSKRKGIGHASSTILGIRSMKTYLDETRPPPITRPLLINVQEAHDIEAATRALSLRQASRLWKFDGQQCSTHPMMSPVLS